MGDSGWAWEGRLLGFSFSQSIYETKISASLTAQPATPLGHTAFGDRLIFGKGVPARPCQPGSRAAAGEPHTSQWGLQTLHLVPGLAFVLICMVLTEVIWQY